MAYTKRTWTTATKLSVQEMNRIEDGVANYNGTTGSARICSGRATFPAHSAAGEQQFVTITLPAGFFTQIPNITACWSARGAGGTMSRVNPIWISEATTGNFVAAWYTDGVALGEHHFDWIAVGV